MYRLDLTLINWIDTENANIFHLIQANKLPFKLGTPCLHYKPFPSPPFYFCIIFSKSTGTQKHCSWFAGTLVPGVSVSVLFIPKDWFSMRSVWVVLFLNLFKQLVQWFPIIRTAATKHLRDIFIENSEKAPKRTVYTTNK